MKKQFFIVMLFAIAIGGTMTTHYACKKEASVNAVNEQQPVSEPTNSNDRDACNQCPGNMGCLTFAAMEVVSLDIYGFEKEPEILVPCGPPLRGEGILSIYDDYIDPNFKWGFKPLCDITLPFRFGLRSPRSYPLKVIIYMQSRTSDDEFCSSQLTTILMPGVIKTFRIFENQEGNCVFTEEACSASE